MTIDWVAGIAVRHPQVVAAGRHYGLQVHTCVPFDPESAAGQAGHRPPHWTVERTRLHPLPVAPHALNLDRRRPFREWRQPVLQRCLSKTTPRTAT